MHQSSRVLMVSDSDLGWSSGLALPATCSSYQRLLPAAQGPPAPCTCITRGSLPLPELRRKDSNVVIGLELLFNCKYNLLWLQKSLTSGNPSWWKSCPSYAQSLWSFLQIPGLSSFQLLSQQGFRMSLIACLPGQQLLAFPSTGYDRSQACGLQSQRSN